MATHTNPIEEMNVGNKVTYTYTACHPDNQRYGKKAIAWCINPDASPKQRRYTAQFENGSKLYPQSESSFALGMIGWNEQL